MSSLRRQLAKLKAKHKDKSKVYKNDQYKNTLNVKAQISSSIPNIVKNQKFYDQSYSNGHNKVSEK